MKFRSHSWSSVAVVLSCVGLSACGSEAAVAEGDAALGALQIDLNAVPEAAACLRVTAEGGSRTVSRSFDLASGAGRTLTIDRLPAGRVMVDAAAYTEPCSSVSDGTAATWITEAPVAVRIKLGKVAEAVLKLLFNGRARLDVDFELPPYISVGEEPVTLAIIGDTPYGAAQALRFPDFVAAINSDARLSGVVHLGDIKNGSTRCDDVYFDKIATDFKAFTIPLVFTPGDNEWTDCHRANNGAYDPLERLGKLRQVFYPTPGVALGAGEKQVLTQADFDGFETFAENQLWLESNVVFSAVHVVGSNNSANAWYGDDLTGTKVDDPARRDAERAERTVAALDWLERSFAIAEEHEATGVVLLMQADTFDAFSIANNLPLESFKPIVQKLADLSRAFAKPVLLLQGDSHVYLHDAPLASGSALYEVAEPVPNLTRVVVQGSNITEYLRLTVDGKNGAVPFTWERVQN